MNTKLLKQKILDLAIRGKLVPQDPNDEPASELLKRIRAEKEKLIAEGKIKRSKKTGDKPHYENENAPFEVPNSWKWCKIEDFAYDLQYGTSEKSLHTGIVPVLRMGNISRDGTVDYTDLVYSSNEEDIAKFSLQLNDLLFNRTNSSEWVGKTAIYKAEKNAIFAGYLIRIRTFIVCPDYINFVMNSSYHRHWCNQVKTDAVNQSNINAQKLSNLLVPVPPINEQKRIVSEIGRWMALIDEIETNKQFMQEFIKQAKSKILDFAIHGKLVPQDPKDEPAVELLKRINPNAPICDTSHYGNLPKGWCVLTVGQVADYINGRAFKPNEWEKEGLPIIRIQNLNDEDAVYNYSKAKYEDRYLVHKGDLLFAWAASLGTYIWQKDDAWLNQHIFKVIPKPFTDKEFLYFSFINMIDDFYSESHGSGMVHITKGKFEERPIFIPPLMEQKRIVLQLKSIYNIIDSICSEL